MECVIAIEFLRGKNDELVAKEVAIVSKNVIQTHNFKSPYDHYFFGDLENRQNWEDSFIPYDQIFTVLRESPSNFAHVYGYGTETCEFVRIQLQVPIHDLQTLLCPNPHKVNSEYRCYLTCRKNFSDVHYATRHAHALYKWLKHHLQTRWYVRCPKDMSCHNATFSAGIKQIWWPTLLSFFFSDGI